VVDDPIPYLASPEWLGAFGRPLLTFVQPTAVGPFTERRVLFETGQEVDFALLPVAAATRMTEDPDGRAVLRRGFRVLVDKLGLEATLRKVAAPPPAPGLPDQAAFAQLTHDFWYHLVWAAKKLRRGELLARSTRGLRFRRRRRGSSLPSCRPVLPQRLDRDHCAQRPRSGRAAGRRSTTTQDSLSGHEANTAEAVE
jgi:hypothetical protein